MLKTGKTDNASCIESISMFTRLVTVHLYLFNLSIYIYGKHFFQTHQFHLHLILSQMNRQASSPSKAKGVSFFNHYPKNILRPYGAADKAPSADVVMARIRPEGCEWLRRPQVAVSELQDTLSANAEILTSGSPLLNDKAMEEFKKKSQPFLELMGKIAKGAEHPAQQSDAKELLGHFLTANDGLGNFYRQAIEVGAALYTSGIKYLVAETLVRDPARYAGMISMADNADAPFKNSKNLSDLAELLYNKKQNSVISVHIQ